MCLDLGVPVVHVRAVAKPRDALADDVCRRLREALEAHPRLRTIAAVTAATGQQDKTVRRWFQESSPSLPGASALVTLGDALEVSVDWMLTGQAPPTVGWAQWLELHRRAEDPEALVRFLRDLPIGGYRAPLSFYTLAAEHWRRSTQHDLVPADFVRSVRESLAP